MSYTFRNFFFSWFVMNHSIYRGMTVLKRNEIHYYPNDENHSQESKGMSVLSSFFIKILINFEYSSIRSAKNFSKHKM
jgi:hypothetical protein